MLRLFLYMIALGVTMTMIESSPAQEGKKPMTVQNLFDFKRVAEAQISPDGKQVVYQITTVDLAANKSTTALWLAATDAKTPPKPLTDPAGKKDMHPRWSPDGTMILFESTRPGTAQLYVIPATGGEPKQLTTISTGAGTGMWSHDGKSIAFESTVFPEFSELPYADADAKNAAKEKAIADSPVKAKTFTKLFYRHWDSYVDDKRRHLFVIDADGKNPRNVTPGNRDAYPTSSTFSVGDDFVFSPDSKFLIFTAVPEKDESWSTNCDLCRVSFDNKSTKWETLTASNKAADNCPRFSPDGKKLAWRAQAKPGYEADKWNIYVVDVKPDGTFVGTPANFTGRYDWSVEDFVWRPSKKNDEVMLIYESKGRKTHHILIMDKNAAAAEGRITYGDLQLYGQLSGFNYSSGASEVLTAASMSAPTEVFANGKNISHANDALLAKLDLPKPESVQVKIEDGEMQMWLLKPPGFDASKKYPVVYLIHGGPQGAWEDGWSYRWNPQIWAAQGYVIAMPNPRGSTGFGQKFVDQISGDWGGKCYRDLVAGLDMIEALPYVDKDRIASAGASFGGYMQNWFAVNDISKRFKCLITHCSVWNFESMWGTTDELWFDEYEHGGLPWDLPQKYREFSPHARAKELGKHKTPMLIIHNDFDFRCPIGQGHELFSALQRQGVPSRFVNFPDEGHWVLKPQNSLHWHNEVFAWLKQYNPPGAK